MNAPSTPVRDGGGRTDRSPPDGASDRKTTLFCPDCEHAAPLDGDWAVDTAGHRRRVRCPDCDHVIDDRRVGGSHPARADGPAPAPVRWCLDAWDRYWSTWTALVTGRANNY
jgi:hypothetical protein